MFGLHINVIALTGKNGLYLFILIMKRNLLITHSAIEVFLNCLQKIYFLASNIASWNSSTSGQLKAIIVFGNDDRFLPALTAMNLANVSSKKGLQAQKI
jgi:hypothetical protein